MLFTKTSIDFTIILGVILVSGLIGFFYDYKRYVFTYKLEGYLSYILSFLQNALFLGGLIGLLFLSINFFLPDHTKTKKEYKIIDRYSVRGRKYHRSERKPVFIIEFNKKEKNIQYSHSYLKEMDSFKSITIESQIGFFGFEIIKNKTLNK
ncbi:hypothetical protein [Polaribacter sp. Z022]|uniref:hypothetical protein n=1 Tax=Polaribacter sp. Z022 TaxID=2927125 RepID=UPI0020204F2C|nr:hypothetical protein [Polaribacter sp. Z022]MCL7754375.1 hypothetical protein [Polaribacter sp. Z022]